MFKEKKVWDLVDRSHANLTIATQTKKIEKDNAITLKTIK